MAVYVYSLTYTDVVAEIPMLDGGSVTATTEPLATGDITQYIEDGAGKLNSMLSARGITADANLDETDHAALVEAVKAYAVSKSLMALGAMGPLYDQSWERWQQVYAEYSNRPQQLGNTYAPQTVVETDGVTTDGGVASHNDYGTEEWSFIGLNSKSNW